MCDRKEITKDLSQRLEVYLKCDDVRTYWAKEVTFDYGSLNQSRVDYMLFKPVNNSTSGIEKGDFYCYEIKSSVEDFKSKNGHNFLGDYNYYVMPQDIYDKVKDFIPFYVGVLIPSVDKNVGVYIIRRAKRHNRDYSLPLMLLMMFRSANRDKIKFNIKAKVEEGV